MTRLALVLALCAPLPAAAQIEARFVEGAPKDTFTLINAGCALGATTVELEMSDSAGGLIFDTNEGGAGVDVFQPFETVSGNVVSVAVSDGTGVLSLSVPDWPEGAEISFTIDVDDVLRHGDLGQTQISGGEIAGAEIRINAGGATEFGVFDNTRRATIRGFCGA